MTDEDIRNLDNPQQANFKPEIWTAVAYARNWALTRGSVRDLSVIADFEKQYSPEQRDEIVAVIRIIDFSNKFNNMWAKPIERS